MRQKISLGYANGWARIPEVVIKCGELGHSRKQETIGRCLTRYSCDECGYEYKVDSSD